MPSHNPAEFGVEAAAEPVLPPRSRLYSLSLIGVGSAAVESITSFIARLARAHAVSTWMLLKHELAPKVLNPEANLRNRLSELTAEMGAAFNGENETSRKLITVLSDLTKRPDLAQGTMSFCAGLVSPRKLVSVKQRWCPHCLNEMKSAGHELYYHLLWHVFSVKACPKHHQQLSSHCPHCRKDFSPLRANTHPGYCPKCHGWLGSTNNAGPATEWDQLMAAAVASLLKDCRVHRVSTASHFPANIRQLLDGHFGGNVAALARFLMINRYTVIAWMGARERPSMEYLTAVSLKVNVPMASLLSQPLTAADFQPQPDHSAQPGRRLYSAPAKVALAAMRQEMEHVVNADQSTGMSLAAIAKKLGCNQTTLKRRFPELAEAVKQRYLTHRKAQMDARIQEVRSQVRSVMLALQSTGIYPSQARLRAKLRGQIDMREPSAQQAWKEVLSELYPAQS